LFGFHVDPAGKNPAAREHERVQAVPVNDGKFEISVEGRTRDGLPHIRVNTWFFQEPC
jgi:hypothetical protein